MPISEPDHDVQVTKRFDEDHCEVSTAMIPGPRQPGFQKIVLAFIKEQRLFNKRVNNRLVEINKHINKIDDRLDRNNLKP